MNHRFFTFLALTGAANAAPFLPKHATTRALELRGGAGPVDADTAAKVCLSASCTTGLYVLCSLIVCFHDTGFGWTYHC